MSALFRPPWLNASLIVAFVLLAAAGARPYAGSWNDGSRLAAVESVVERGTLAIDGSVFVDPDAAPADHPPYRSEQLRHGGGTRDKLFIAGRFHSDKPPVISCVMAAVYAPGRAWGLLPPVSERPDRFAWLMTLFTSVAAYAVALVCMERLAAAVGLRGWLSTLWLAAFAGSTFALAYTRHVNNHVLQLAVVAAWALMAVRLSADREENGKRRPYPLLLGMGALLGLGYNLDLGSGPPMLAIGLALAAWRTRDVRSTLAVAAAALPGVAACHAVNYAVGGVLGPLNAVPAFFDWPGCPFGEGNMTGVLRHSPGKLLVYALALLFGKHGVLVHNLPLLLCLPAIGALWRPSPHRPVVLAGLAWCAATWGLYSLMSNNYGGVCCSVRWFVPFLAPGFLLLAVYLTHQPERARDLAALAAWGAVLGAVMWLGGPWSARMVPGLWPIVAGALLTWLAVRLPWPRRRAAAEEEAPHLVRAA
jgi:hypothetical protein